MVDLGQKRRKKFRLFYWNKVKKKERLEERVEERE